MLSSVQHGSSAISWFIFSNDLPNASRLVSKFRLPRLGLRASVRSVRLPFARRGPEACGRIACRPLHSGRSRLDGPGDFRRYEAWRAPSRHRRGQLNFMRSGFSAGPTSHASLKLRSDRQPASENHAIELLRIFQEALTNVRACTRGQPLSKCRCGRTAPIFCLRFGMTGGRRRQTNRLNTPWES